MKIYQNTATLKTVHTKSIEKKRIEYLDIARTFAIICVVLCHCVGNIYQFNLKEWNDFSILSNIFKMVVFTIGRLGVPIFLLITGFLTLNKQINNDDDVKQFYKKNLMPIILTTEIWIIIYTVFFTIYNGNKFSIETLIRRMLFFESSPANMWYMPMIIGMYIAIPFISKVLKDFSIKTLKIPMIMVMILCFVLPTLNNILKMFKIKTYTSILDISFLGGGYGLYMLIGYFIRKGFFKNIKSSLLGVVSIVSFALACIMQIVMYEKGIAYNIWYNSIFLLMTTVPLFELFTRIKINSHNIKSIFTYISKISFGIFFMHEISLNLFSKYIKLISVIKPLKVLILSIAVFVTSVIIIMILSKIKVIKNKVFLIKG